MKILKPLISKINKIKRSCFRYIVTLHILIIKMTDAIMWFSKNIESAIFIANTS